MIYTDRNRFDRVFNSFDYSKNLSPSQLKKPLIDLKGINK